LQTPAVFWIVGVNVSVSYVMYRGITEIHTAEPPVPDPSAFEFEMAVEKLKRHTLPGIDEIPAELINAGGTTIRSENHKLINSIWNKEDLPEQWKELFIVTI
jgi:hypothetical protein